jgi:hypothetical protein
MTIPQGTHVRINDGLDLVDEPGTYVMWDGLFHLVSPDSDFGREQSVNPDGTLMLTEDEFTIEA